VYKRSTGRPILGHEGSRQEEPFRGKHHEEAGEAPLRRRGGCRRVICHRKQCLGATEERSFHHPPTHIIEKQQLIEKHAAWLGSPEVKIKWVTFSGGGAQTNALLSGGVDMVNTGVGNAGSQGSPGMPEWGMLPSPKKLVKQGVRDMLRLSDTRMSGTSYGACILHVSPEAYIGGPLALVRTGDMISVDVAERTISLNVSDEELERRRAAWASPEPRFERGYGWMFTRHIKQAHEGCDFDFLETSFGAPTGEPAIY
jgi:hypothetical protein